MHPAPLVPCSWSPLRRRMIEDMTVRNLAPSFETFGPHPQLFPAIGLQLVTSAEMPRVFFVNNDNTQLLQVQRDRFIHNWRKVEAGGD